MLEDAPGLDFVLIHSEHPLRSTSSETEASHDSCPLSEESGSLFSRTGSQQIPARSICLLAHWPFWILTHSGALALQLFSDPRRPLCLHPCSPVCRSVGAFPSLASFLGCLCPSLVCESCPALSLCFNCCFQLPSDCSFLKILRGWCPGSAAGWTRPQAQGTGSYLLRRLGL